MKLFFALLLFGKIFASDFEAEEVSFDGRCMQLSGKFKWEHPFGSLQGKTATAYFDQEGKNHLPYELVMQEGIEMTMKEGAQLISPYARLDCRLWQGFFHGHEGSKISYENFSENLSLNSLEMEFSFVPPSKDHLVYVDCLIAKGNVEMQKAQDLYLTADCAVFDQFSPKGAFGRAIFSKEEAPCHLKRVTNGSSESIFCEKLEINLQDQIATLYTPNGTIQTKSAPLHFKGSQMTINKGDEWIELDPPIEMNWLGTIEADGALRIFQKQKELSKIQVDGPLKLYWKNPVDGSDHRLTSSGSLIIDPLLQTAAVESKISDLGAIESSDQVSFLDHYGKVFADQMRLIYKNDAGQLIPIALYLEGNVRLQNNTPGALQYALADKASLAFGEKTLTLQATVRPRVLFYDELNKVQASAPSLVINRDAKTGQDEIKGIGNVRFIFAEDELNELKKRFSFDPK